MGMDMVKYHRFITDIEASDWFQDHLRKGELEINYDHHIGDLCNTGSLGQFTENEFIFSCRNFAVTYNISPKVAVDKNWHTLRHINQRNCITARLMKIIGRLQEDYLLTHDPINIRRLPYQQILDEYKRLSPESYIDHSVISRVVNNIIVEVNGKTISLNEVLPRKSHLIGIRIVKLLETLNPLLSDRELQKELRDRYSLQITRRYVSYCRNLMGIPVARLRKKKHGNFFSPGSVDPDFFHLACWIPYRRSPVCMDYV